MLKQYPVEIELQEAHSAMQTFSAAEAEQEMERLGEANVVRIRRVSENHVYYRITTTGRNYLLSKPEDSRA